MKKFFRNLNKLELMIIALSAVIAFFSAFFQLLNDAFGIDITVLDTMRMRYKLLAAAFFISVFTVLIYKILKHRRDVLRKVFLLIPKVTTHTNQSRRDDVNLVLTACKDFINNNGLQGIFEIIEDRDLDDHSVLNATVSEKTNAGYKYFVSFFSDISKALIKDWTYRKSMNENPILICTVTSSDEIKTIRNLVYRFYIRSEDEALCLSTRCFKDKNLLNIETITSLAEGQSEYGQSAVKTFKKEWENKRKQKFIDGQFIDSSNPMAEALTKLVKTIKENNISAIFIALYGGNIKTFLKTWETHCNSEQTLQNVKLIFTSTFMVYEWIKDCFPEIEKRDIITCLPEKEGNLRYWTGADINTLQDISIINDFVKESLSKVKMTIDRVDDTEMFHLYWLDSRNENDKFQYYILKNGDSKIFLDTYRIKMGVNENK